MTTAPLHLDPTDPADTRDDVRFGYLGPQRVAVWPGERPLDVGIAGIAPIVDVPLEDHYGEALPSGIRLVDHEPPPELATVIVTRLMRILADLHERDEFHGHIDDRRVMIGHLGQVVLFGRGRRPGSRGHDVIACMALLPASAEITMPGATARQTAAVMESQLPPNAEAKLAAWVQQVAPASVDEIVPDLGAEHDNTGLLDRYTEAAAPTVEDAKDEDSSTQINVGETLWRTLAAPALHKPPPKRFRGVDGEPSLAIAQLLASSPPQLVSIPAIGPIPSFVVDTPMEADPDYESSNTVKGPLMEVAAIEAAARRAKEAPTDPAGVDVPSAPSLPPPPPKPAPGQDPSPVRVVAIVLLVAIAAAAVAVLVLK